MVSTAGIHVSPSQGPACPPQGDTAEDSLLADGPDRTSVLRYCLTTLRNFRKLLISLPQVHRDKEEGKAVNIDLMDWYGMYMETDTR